MQNRRDFLKYGSIAAAGGLLLTGSVNIFGQSIDKSGYFPLPPKILSDKSTFLNKQSFEPLIDQLFTVSVDDSSKISMRLVEIVSAGDNLASRVSIDAFSLIFEVREGQLLDDRIYDISHNDIGTVPIFVSTVGRSQRRFQAVFSRVYN